MKFRLITRSSKLMLKEGGQLSHPEFIRQRRSTMQHKYFYSTTPPELMSRRMSRYGKWILQIFTHSLLIRCDIYGFILESQFIFIVSNSFILCLVAEKREKGKKSGVSRAIRRDIFKFFGAAIASLAMSLRNVY